MYRKRNKVMILNLCINKLFGYYQIIFLNPNEDKTKPITKGKGVENCNRI